MSLQQIAEKIGISKSFLQMILDRKRHLSIDKLSKVAKAFKMDRAEKNYFIFLACKNLVASPDMNEFFGDILSVMKAGKGLHYPSLEEELANQKIFESSLKMILRSLPRFKNYQDDPKWIQKQLSGKKYTLDEIKQALAENKEVPLHSNAPQGDFNPRAEFQRFKIGLRAAADMCEAPELYKPLQSYMCSHSFDAENEQKAFDLFVELRGKLKELSDQSKDPISVLFVSNNLFCVANKVD